MTPLELDARFTFDSFVVGPSNRLAAAAARRVSDSPGSVYNPLFIYSASGLGKTHLVMAIGHHAGRVHPEIAVMYDTVEHLMDEILSAIQAGERDAFLQHVRGAGMLLLDDVQFLAGRRSAQEELLRAWDSLSFQGGQVVLASDRPPTEIDGLDDRLLSRFSGGLIVDIDVPDYETRVAIVKRKAEDRGHTLEPGVAEALARISHANVRELQGGLNRLLAVQELDRRSVGPDEVGRLLGVTPESARSDEFGSFLSEIAGAVTEVVDRASPEQRLAGAILEWSREGYQTQRLEAALLTPPFDHVDELLAAYAADVARLKEIVQELAALNPAAPELSRTEVLKNPDQLEAAGRLLATARVRARPLPQPPAGPTFQQLELPADSFAVRAARAIPAEPGERYNPFFVYGDESTGKTALLTALALELKARHPQLPLGFLTGRDFADDLITAIQNNAMEGWRSRYRRARVLMVDDVEALADTERAQEELFHLFDQILRAGGQLVFAARQPPRELGGIQERLRSRMDSGLVVDIAAAARAAPVALAEATPAGLAIELQESGPGPDQDAWFLDGEKVLWEWPYPGDFLVEEVG